MPVTRRPPSSGAPPKRTDNSMFTHNLQIRVRRPPSQPSDLELIEAPGPTLTNGAFLARTLWLALDPFVCAPDAAAHDAVFGVGSLVVLECGLQQLCVSDGRHARLLHSGQTPASSALGVLGAPGMAAYFGLLDLAQLRPGETVLVSAAADAAGAMAGQIAMLKGARAIGIASNRERCDWVTRHARLSACINHAAENVSARLKALATRGVDVYFDNTGGELLDTIVAGRHLAAGGRIVQNTVKVEDPEAILARGGYLPGNAQVRALRVRACDYEHRRGEFLRDAIAWYGAGRIAAKEHVVEGLANAPAHLLLAMQHGNFGRPLVRV